MKKLLAWQKAYMTEEDAATAIEYGLIAAGIALAIVVSVFAFGDDLSDMFTTMATQMETVDTAVGNVDPTSGMD